MPEELKIFVSWSGAQSKEIALALKSLLMDVSDLFRPFVSDRDIESGSRGLNVVAEELQGTRLGIVVVTADNHMKPWLNFEAGALSKTLDPNTRVIPLLFGIKGTDLPSGSPLVQFQYREYTKDSLSTILSELSAVAGVNDSLVQNRYLSAWNLMEIGVTSALDQSADETPTRSNTEMLEEVLNLVRGLRNSGEHGSPGDTQPVTFIRVRSSLLREAVKFAAGTLGLTSIIVRQNPEGNLVISCSELDSANRRTIFIANLVGAAQLIGEEVSGLEFKPTITIPQLRIPDFKLPDEPPVTG